MKKRAGLKIEEHKKIRISQPNSHTAKNGYKRKT